MDPLHILRRTIRLLVAESLDAAWQPSPLAVPVGDSREDRDPVDEEDCGCSDEDVKEFGGGYSRPCGC